MMAQPPPAAAGDDGLTPRFGRRAQAQAALKAANQALADLPPTPDEFKQQYRTMQRATAAQAAKTQAQEEKADRLAQQVQSLFAQLQAKDREIERVTNEKREFEDKWRKAEVARVQSEVGGKQGSVLGDSALDQAMASVCMVTNLGPKFERELKDFVESKVEAKRLVDMRKEMSRLNPFGQLQGRQEKSKTAQEEVLQRVRDVVYRKGTEIRFVFRALDEDKSGSLSHEEFRIGLQKMGAYLSDDEWEVLLDVVDVNRDGEVQYIEFAETMKVNDIQMSFLAGPAPYANAQEWHGKVEAAGGKANKLDREGRGGQLMVGGAMGPGGVNGYNPANAPQRTKHQEGYGMNLLPKHDILRRLAELIELKHRNMGRAFMQYDKNRDGSIDRDEFRQMLNDMGLTISDQEFVKLMRRIDKNDDGSVDLIEWWKQFHENACSGPAGAAGGIAGASWHIDAPRKEARGVRGAFSNARLDPDAGMAQYS